jgi:hypothetical protein
MLSCIGLFSFCDFVKREYNLMCGRLPAPESAGIPACRIFQEESLLKKICWFWKPSRQDACAPSPESAMVFGGDSQSAERLACRHFIIIGYWNLYDAAIKLTGSGLFQPTLVLVDLCLRNQ